MHAGRDSLSQASAGPAATSEWRQSWPVVLAGTAGMSLAAVGTYSMGVMIAPIEQELGWSRAEISSGPAMVSLICICVASLMGLAVDRFGARLVGSLSAALLCAALALMSTATGSLWTWWALWAVLGFAQASMPTVWTAPIGQRFSKSRGLALAIVLSGTGIGATLVPLITGFVVANYDWRTGYLVLGGVWAMMTLPIIALGLRGGGRSPAEPGTTGKAAQTDAPGLTVRQGFRSLDFYRIAVPTCVGILFGVAMIMNMVPILNAGGLSLQTAASIAGIIGVTTIIGRIIGGYLLDRFDARRIASAVTLAPIIFALFMILLPGSVPAAIIAVALYGLTSGPKIAAVVYLAGKYFGQRNFGVLFGTIQALMALGMGLGPLLANVVYDRTQSYVPFLWASVPVFVVCALIFLTLGKPPTFETVQGK